MNNKEDEFGRSVDRMMPLGWHGNELTELQFRVMEILEQFLLHMQTHPAAVRTRRCEHTRNVVRSSVEMYLGCVCSRYATVHMIATRVSSCSWRCIYCGSSVSNVWSKWPQSPCHYYPNGWMVCAQAHTLTYSSFGQYMEQTEGTRERKRELNWAHAVSSARTRLYGRHAEQRWAWDSAVTPPVKKCMCMKSRKAVFHCQTNHLKRAFVCVGIMCCTWLCSAQIHPGKTPYTRKIAYAQI